MNKSNMLELHADALAERVNEGENNTAFFRACLGLETTALDDDAAARIAELEARQCEKCEASIEEHSELTFQIAERDRRIAELEAQLAEALMSAYVAERHRETAEESESVANARLKEAEEREAKMRAILEGAGYDDLDDLDDTLTRSIEDCRSVGETVGDITRNHIEYADKASALRVAVEAENARLRAVVEALEWIGRRIPYCPWCLCSKADGHSPACARQAALRPEAGEGEKNNAKTGREA